MSSLQSFKNLLSQPSLTEFVIGEFLMDIVRDPSGSVLKIDDMTSTEPDALRVVGFICMRLLKWRWSDAYIDEQKFRIIGQNIEVIFTEDQGQLLVQVV